MKFIIVMAVSIIVILSLAGCITINTGPTEPTTAPPTTSGPPPSATNTPPGTTTPPTLPTPPTITPTPTITVTPEIPFEDRTWVLVKYGVPGSLQNVISGKESTARFESSTGKVSGSGACNSYNASYTAGNGNIQVSNIMRTNMLCFPSEVNQQESDFLKILANADTYEVEGNELRIFGSANRILIFKPK